MRPKQQHNFGTDLSITSAAVTGGNVGIFANNRGSGSLIITANGDVTGTGTIGIGAFNYFNGTDLSITTSRVTGGNFGITADNRGTGALTITANGDVTGTNRDGIDAYNSRSSTDLSITTARVTGGYIGIFAENRGSGALTITANGDVSGNARYGIYVRNSGASLNVTTDGTVTGGLDGIRARNYVGSLVITANGDVTGTSYSGIYARNYGSDLTVTTGSVATVIGGRDGIYARNLSSGAALTITVNGDVTGTGRNGIYAFGAGAPIGTPSVPAPRSRVGPRECRSLMERPIHLRTMARSTTSTV